MPAKLTKTSMITGMTRCMTFPQISQEEFDKRYAAWQRKQYMIQEAFPMLSADEREFIKTGITSDEWDRYMSDED